MTEDMAIMIIQNFKSFLRNEEKLRDKKFDGDVFVAFDKAVEALKKVKES